MKHVYMYKPVRRGEGVRTPPPPPPSWAIISNSCSFSSETEFTLLILAPKSEFSYDSHPLCKNPWIRTPLFKGLRKGLHVYIIFAILTWNILNVEKYFFIWIWIKYTCIVNYCGLFPVSFHTVRMPKLEYIQTHPVLKCSSFYSSNFQTFSKPNVSENAWNQRCSVFRGCTVMKYNLLIMIPDADTPQIASISIDGHRIWDWLFDWCSVCY